MIVKTLRLFLTAALLSSAVLAPGARSAPSLAVEERCHQQADRDMLKPVAVPLGSTRALELERTQRVRLCLVQASEPNEAELLSHHHYKAKDGHEIHSPAKSTHDQVPTGASAKCRDGTYSFSQHRRGTCSRHGGVGSWL